jgi:hypothetical protein
MPIRVRIGVPNPDPQAKWVNLGRAEVVDRIGFMSKEVRKVDLGVETSLGLVGLKVVKETWRKKGGVI